MGLKQSAFFCAWIASSYIRVLMGAIIFLLPPIIIHTNGWTEINGKYKIDTDYPIGFWDMYIVGTVGRFFLLYILYAIAAVHQSFALNTVEKYLFYEFFYGTVFSDSKLAGELDTKKYGKIIFYIYIVLSLQL